MADVTTLLLERYNSKRAEHPSQVPAPNPAHSSYLQASAVLHCFVPEALAPLDSNLYDPRPRLLLFDDIVRETGESSDGLYTLKSDVRRKTLRDFPSREVMRQALDANPKRTITPLQQMWEDYLRNGAVPSPEKLTYHQLMNLYQIVSWLDGIDPNLPDQSSVLDLIHRKSVVASFEHLVISNFTGRVDELNLLREHIGAMLSVDELQDPEKITAWLQTHKPILSVFGPGGIGKSALMGHILWEQVQSDSQTRVPFAYLAFDQPTLRIDAPFTLLIESAAQFELQFPERSGAIDQFRERVREFRDARSAFADQTSIRATRGDRISDVQTLNTKLYFDFAQLLETIGQIPVGNNTLRGPVLLALDTFEQVQYQDLESMTGFWRMLSAIQAGYPLFRVIISGRAAIANLGVRPQDLAEIELKELAMPDRATLLQRLGVTDPEIAQSVAQQVGGNPLSLQLAANVITSDATAATAQGIKDLGISANGLSFQVDEQLIQGQLYRRILDQIHDENVRKLAHPGMVLRRVSPELILKVLAPVCGITLNGLAEAETLFEELRREHGLVEEGEESALIYRPEIRQAMVRLLEQDKFAEVRELRHAAIAYYEDKDDIISRGEEMYHRLVLDQDPTWVLNQRWMSGIEQSLAASLDEYPDRSKAWLASRMSLEVPRSVFADADAAEWERNTTRKVQRALSELETDNALKLLGERQERSVASPLFALEAKAYLLRNDLDNAWKVLEQGVARVSTSTNRGRLAELFWLQAQVALLRNDPLSGDQLLERAERAIENASNPLPLIHILGHRLLLREEYPLTYPETALQLRPLLAVACDRAEDSMIYGAPFVIQLAILMLGNEFPQTTGRLKKLVTPLPTIPPDILTSENLGGLQEYRESWENDDDRPSSEAAA